MNAKKIYEFNEEISRYQDRFREAYDFHEAIRVANNDGFIRDEKVSCSFFRWILEYGGFLLTGSVTLGARGCYDTYNEDHWISFEDFFDHWEEWKFKMREDLDLAKKREQERYLSEEDSKRSIRKKKYGELKKEFGDE